MWAVIAEVPAGTGDEALTGIVALHVAEGRAFPAYLYGQFYMGAFEAYVAAPFVAVFGSTVTALRLGMIVLFAIFFWSSYRVAALFDHRFAVVVAGVLALGSDRVLRDQLMTNGGYPEMLALGALLAWLTARLCVERRHAVEYAAWGAVAGLVFWADWLIAPYIGCLGVVVLARRWRDLPGWRGAGLLLGTAAGLLPLIAYNVRAAEGQDTLTAVLAFDELPASASPWEHYFRAVIVNVPRATGMCGPECAPWQLWWSVAYQVLLVAAVVIGVRTIRTPQGALLVALSVAALITIVLYARSPRAVQDPFWNARYLSNLLISTPAVLWPIWLTGRRLLLFTPVLATALVATAAVFTTSLPAARADTGALHRLIGTLDRIGADRVYTDFQLCHRIVYVSGERIRCATIDHDLIRGWDRYPPYREAVDAAPRPVYILRAGEPMDHQMASYLHDARVPADVHGVAGWRIYVPSRRVDVPTG